MQRRRLAVVIIGLSTLALSGCMRVTSDYVLNENDTISGEMVFALSDAALEGSEDTGEGFGREEAAANLQNATVTDYKQDGFTGELVTFVDEPLDSFSALSSDITVVREGDEFVVTGQEPGPEASPSPGQPSASEQLKASGAEARISVTFPGKVSSHNGTLDGRTVSWDILTMKEAPSARGSAVLDESIPAGTASTSNSTAAPIEASATPSPSPSASPSASASASAAPAAAATADSEYADDESGISPVLILGIAGAVLAIALGVLAGWLIGRNKRNAAAAPLGDQAYTAPAPYAQPAAPADPFLPTQGDAPPAP